MEKKIDPESEKIVPHEEGRKILREITLETARKTGSDIFEHLPRNQDDPFRAPVNSMDEYALEQMRKDLEEDSPENRIAS